MSVALALDNRKPEEWPASANDAEPANRSLLRFITCGSVDDGKSTLIGRMLFEAQAVPEDTLVSLEADSRKVGTTGGGIDYALLVDGLSAEREQGITIDVAYRYFSTPRRSFIVADTPGHEQYTRNMATGASTADLAVILIDASKGILPQTRRHSLIVSLVGVRHVVVAINKMDLIDFVEGRYREIAREYRSLASALGFLSITVIPVAARDGDNIAVRSERMDWYEGPPLLRWLETINADQVPLASHDSAIVPVQYVNRPSADFRGFCGTLATGQVRVGDAVKALPSGQTSRVARIIGAGAETDRARTGQAITLVLDSEIDVSRGDVLTTGATVTAPLLTAQDMIARVLVTGDQILAAGSVLTLRIGTVTANASITEIVEQFDINDLSLKSAAMLAMNSLGTIRLRLDRPIVHARYDDVRELGSMILIDRISNETVALGIIPHAAKADRPKDNVPAFSRLTDRFFRKAIGPHWRMAILPMATWRLASATILAAVFFAWTHNIQASLLAGVVDLAFRPVLKTLHRQIWVWARRSRDPEAALLQDGGGI